MKVCQFITDILQTIVIEKQNFTQWNSCNRIIKIEQFAIELSDNIMNIWGLKIQDET